MSVPMQNCSFGRWLIILAFVVITAAVAASFLVAGTPAERRAVRLDERRIADLSHLSDVIDAYWRHEKRLPASLDVLARKPGRRLDTTDPETDAPYEYSATGAKSYRLCAVFTTDTAQRRTRRDAKWDHGIGRQCFDDRATND